MPRTYIRIPAVERFLSKIKVQENGCWEWMGSLDRKGYGLFYDGQTRQTHRFSYEYFKGIIPQGLTLDHLCRNHSCVNPDHLEAVTLQENVQRGLTGFLAGERQSSKTHCPQGHPYNDINTYHIPTGGRGCKICRLERTRQFRLVARGAL